MENRAHAIATGLFIIVFVTALVAAAIWFSGNTAKEDIYLLVSKSSVSGLNPEAAVRYRGLQVGRVEKILLDPQQHRTILVRILVDSGTPITQGTYAELAYQGLTGLAYIQLDDDGTAPTPLQTSPEAPARIEMRTSLLQEVEASAPLLLARINMLTERMSNIFDDENLKHVKDLLANIEQVSARLVMLQDKLDPTIAALPSVVTNTRGVLEKADTLLIDLSTLTAELQQQVMTFDRVAASAEKVAASAEKIGAAGEAVGDEVRSSALPKFDRLLDDLSRTSKNLDRLLTDIERRPQSLVFGKPLPQPGPGEPGFTAPP
jgi:phospholipid/cholesterol/gamma-HCH transport system substrate-binding protein